MNFGFGFAFLAIIAWAFDDFFIGRAARRFGSVGALFLLALFGVLILLPFIWTEIWQGAWLTGRTLLTMGALVVITAIAALADFEALRVGKLSAIDPLYAFEIPITVMLSFFILGETLRPAQLALIGVIILGMFLVSAQSLRSLKAIRWERGVRFAIVSIIFMGGTNFFTGLAARLTSPLLANWLAYVGLALCTGVLIAVRGNGKRLLAQSGKHWRLILALGISDVIAWTSFTHGTVYLPIGLVTAITESYIVLAVLLGVYENKERLRLHQYAGIGVIVCAVISLALAS